MGFNAWGGFNSWGSATQQSKFNYYRYYWQDFKMQKNVSGQKVVVFAFDTTTNEAVTGDAANITANIIKDGGSSSAVADTNPTETEAGFYSFDLTQAETNADYIQVIPSSITSDVQVISVPGVIYTTPQGFADGVMQTADHTAAIADIPTVSEFNARTLLSGDYFDASTDSVDISTSSVNSVFAGGNIDGYSLDESLRVILAASAGKLSGAETNNIIIRDTQDTKNRIDADVDSYGNRTGVTLNVSS